MQFLRNTWYAAAWTEQVSEQPSRRTIIGQPIVLFRRKDGVATALADVCPHRFARLSAGVLRDDVLECPYHGLQFDTNGVCVLNPHGPITSKMMVRSYPIIERHGVVWAWLGIPASASDTLIPDLSFMDFDPNRKTVHNYLGVVQYRFDILMDNLLDLSHEDYLHRGSFSGGAGEPAELSVSEVDQMVVVERITRNMPPRPRYEFIGDRVDVRYVIRWWPSQVVAFERIYSSTHNPEAANFTARFCHLATPETGSTTHYFHAVTRTEDPENVDIDQRIAEIAKSVILGEDGPMLEAIDQQMDGAELMHLDPVILPTDAGGLRVRAVMRRLCSDEWKLQENGENQADNME